MLCASASWEDIDKTESGFSWKSTVTGLEATGTNQNMGVRNNFL